MRRIVPDDVLLFRYSALTFNSHRIHYDRRYATEAEGYPGLVVHGPLLATLLVDLWRRQQPGATLSQFEFRALRPLFDTAPFDLCGQPDNEGRIALWAQRPDGAVAMRATATCPEPEQRAAGRAACRGNDRAPARRHPRRLPRARDRRAVLHAPACGPWCARDQDRASGRRRLCTRLRPARARHGLAFRVDQSLQAKPDAGCETGAGAGSLARSDRTCRRAGAESRARGSQATRPGRSRAAAAASAAGGLRHLGLRRRRALSRQESLRSAHPERSGLPLGDRHAGRAREGGLLDRRYRRGHVRLYRYPRCPAAAAKNRPGVAHRGVDARVAHRMDELPAVLRVRGRKRARSHRRGSRHDLPLWAVRGR